MCSAVVLTTRLPEADGKPCTVWILCTVIGCSCGKRESPGFQTMCLDRAHRLILSIEKKTQNHRYTVAFYKLKLAHGTLFPPCCHRSHSCAFNSAQSCKPLCWAHQHTLTPLWVQLQSAFGTSAAASWVFLIANIHDARKMLMKHREGLREELWKWWRVELVSKQATD